MADMKQGWAERIYDFMVVLGMNPVPWQHEFLRKWEQRSMDEKFAEIVRSASSSP